MSPGKKSDTKKPGKVLQRQSAPPPEIRADCWCGASDFRAFGPDYLRCDACGTLVSQKGLSTSELTVVDDEHDYYGKQYWLQHQERDLGLPDFESRIRNDLPERNLHWLRTLLNYALPPAKVVELGCAHGSFVALMEQAGYAASGVEMSPWVVDFGRATFGIDVQTGPVEKLDIAPGSLDAITMMDVMEHLPDPVATLRHCLGLLKRSGFLLIQMPNFREEMDFDELVASGSTFLSQLKSDEHLYLYSKRSVTEFFHRLGADHVAFEPAIFAHYDMFIVVSRTRLKRNGVEAITAALQATPRGRVALAMLDMKDRFDRYPGLEAELTKAISDLHATFARTDELRNERNLAIAELEDAKAKFAPIEEDRAARGRVIERQGEEISKLQGELDRRLRELEPLYPRMEELRNLVNLRQAEVAALQAKAVSSEQDRAARGEVIERQGRQISELQAEVDRWLKELEPLYPRMEELKNLANLRQAELATLQAQSAANEQDRVARGDVIERQGRQISELQAEVDRRLKELEPLYPRLDELGNLVNLREAEVATLRAQVSSSEHDRAARGEVIERQGARISELQGEVDRRLKDLETLYGRMDEFENRAKLRETELAAALLRLEATESRLAARDAELNDARRHSAALESAVVRRTARLRGARAVLAERKRRYRSEQEVHAAQMESLARRWWWKLGKLLKTL
jgi:2-polyprenyl-3-methyl-5-hydroxy-6-metoxy-1,4-benzoquinol methylase/predicted  nucleic acid-binding Zn-ribbon protein